MSSSPMQNQWRCKKSPAASYPLTSVSPRSSDVINTNTRSINGSECCNTYPYSLLPLHSGCCSSFDVIKLNLRSTMLSATSPPASSTLNMVSPRPSNVIKFNIRSMKVFESFKTSPPFSYPLNIVSRRSSDIIQSNVRSMKGSECRKASPAAY